MYNESLKTKFIRGYTNSINTANVCQTIFNAIEKYESGWNADMCTQKEDVLQPVIDEIIGFRVRSKWMRIIILKDYVRWCISTGVPNACDGMLNINASGLEKIKRQTVSSPVHLENYLNSICEPTDRKTTDNIYRCYYWLAYAGVKEEDILKVKCSDVDFSRMVVKYGDTEVPIYREAVPAFKNCVELTQFVYNHPNYSSDVWKDRVPGDTVVRGLRAQSSSKVRDQYSSIKSMRAELSRRSKSKRDDGHTSLKLSYYRVWISGVFYRTYENEQMGIEPDFSIVVSQHVEGKTYKLDSGRNTQAAKKRQLAHDYLEDYQRWKLAYKK